MAVKYFALGVDFGLQNGSKNDLRESLFSIVFLVSEKVAPETPLEGKKLDFACTVV